MKWYHRISSCDPKDLNALSDALAQYAEFSDGKYEEISRDAKLSRGDRIEALSAKIPGLAEYNYGFHQEADAIMKYLEIQADLALSSARKTYTDAYNRKLNSTQIEKYADADPTVMAYRLLSLEIGLIRGKFAGISKNLEYAHFQLSNIVKLRTSGIEDATL